MLFFQCPVLPEIFFRSSDLAMLDGIVGEMKHDDPEEIREAYKYAFRDPGKSSKQVYCQYHQLKVHVNQFYNFQGMVHFGNHIFEQIVVKLISVSHVRLRVTYLGTSINDVQIFLVFPDPFPCSNFI